MSRSPSFRRETQGHGVAVASLPLLWLGGKSCGAPCFVDPRCPRRAGGDWRRTRAGMAGRTLAAQRPAARPWSCTRIPARGARSAIPSGIVDVAAKEAPSAAEPEQAAREGNRNTMALCSRRNEGDRDIKMPRSLRVLPECVVAPGMGLDPGTSGHFLAKGAE